MDIATLIGLIGAALVAITAMSMSGGVPLFINPPSLVIVIGGTLAATMVRLNMKQFIGLIGIGKKALMYKIAEPQTLITEAVELAGIARKEGVLALEGREMSDPFLQTGIGYCIDGHPPEVVQKMLSKDINLRIERHDMGVQFFKSIGDAAPAMGMVGTLIGLVGMLSNMSDPKAIGPAMAIALLTTLYGALIANAFALPIADKLKMTSNQEKLNKKLVLEAVSAIQAGTNPRVLEQMLMSFLPESKRTTDDKG